MTQMVNKGKIVALKNIAAVIHHCLSNI